MPSPDARCFADASCRPRRSPPAPAAPHRDAAAARSAILDAADKRLVIGGAAGIRLQEGAADAGVSHPTVLHHFGSREGLVKAVVTRALLAIHADLVRAIQASSGEEDQLAAMLEAVFEALTATGHARVLLWLALEGHRAAVGDVRLTDVIDATHTLRKSKLRGKGRVPPREDTANTVVLGALALVAGAVLLPGLLENAGLPSDGRKFRAWLAHVL